MNFVDLLRVMQKKKIQAAYIHWNADKSKSFIIKKLCWKFNVPPSRTPGK